jgi:diadenosine tetraphosphatase ApaH/serine/threonine PP2A family protein phosphatase
VAVRIAVLSDIHSNLPALEAVLAGVGSVDGIWVLGDTVGYGAEPEAVIARLQGMGAVAVQGNHDAAAAGAAILDWFNPEAREAIEWTRDRLSPGARAWLQGLPTRRTEAGVAMVHGSFRDPLWEYVTSPAEAAASLARQETRLALHGHTHIPVAWRRGAEGVGAFLPRDGAALDLDDDWLLVNPGSVGQPRDGDPRASFLILDLDRRRLEWRRVTYPVEQAAEAIRRAGLPERFAARLAHGI